MIDYTKINNKQIGDLGENIAKQYLINSNYKIIFTKFSCKQGEIDIVGLDKKELVFVEVKTRINNKFGYPIEAVNVNKQKHIKKVAQYFIYKNRIENFNIRFDIIEIYLKLNKYQLRHTKNVLW